ncbi:MAG: KUP/HAK/KT family potassium transporter, partial [Kofleriaceae bacterium]|nr:KUP/HAK/KT family potassium transporter [Kofleriaceae bacterium]
MTAPAPAPEARPTGSRRRHETRMSGSGHGPQSRREVAGYALGALGVVFGDIGTSPLYAIKECTHHLAANGDGATVPAVMGVLSLVFWSLALVICVKYAVFVLRADNKGEGGILSLGALVGQAAPGKPGRLAVTILLAMFGTGLLFGEGIITPAISVLGAVEGLSVATTAFDHLVLPITLGILVALFMVQRFGTHRIGAVFGWTMAVWFIAIAAAGLPAILANPGVL